jgi:hypothetical protein
MRTPFQTPDEIREQICRDGHRRANLREGGWQWLAP